MATVTFIKYERQSAGALRGVTGYVAQKEKTMTVDGQQLVSGHNCNPQLACQEFLATRAMYRKDSPAYFYHYVQSFHPDEAVTGQLAHEAAKAFAARAWPDSEVLITTHMDAPHIHSHFIVNAVCFDTGRMLRQGPRTLAALRPLSDEICLSHHLSVLPKQQKKAHGMSTREYRAAAKGESWKFQLINTIDECMQYASNRDEFIDLMRTEGYDVRWEATRKNITYTTPSGMKCRDERLHNERYLKEAMEREFHIRQGIIAGRTQAAEQNSAATRADAQCVPFDAGEAGQSVLQSEHHLEWSRGLAGAGRSPASENLQHTVTDEQPADTGGADPDRQDSITDTADLVTGWEAERTAYFSPAFEPAPSQPSTPAHPGDSDRVLGSVVQLGHALERNQDAAPVMDGTTMRSQTDKKTLSKERKKKIATGGAPDDHEDKQNWQQTM